MNNQNPTNPAKNHERQRWRRYRPRRRLTIGPLGLVVPLVNVALLAVLFLVLKSGVVLRPGIILQLPQSEFVAGTAYNTMVLVMTQEGLIFFNDNRIPLEGLASALNQAAHRNRQVSLSIEADLRVQYGMVVRVINMAMASWATIVEDLPPHVVNPSSPLVTTLGGAYQRHTHAAPRCLSIGGCTYARLMPDGVSFGPEFFGHPATDHAPDEYIELDDLLVATRIYASAMFELLLGHADAEVSPLHLPGGRC